MYIFPSSCLFCYSPFFVETVLLLMVHCMDRWMFLSKISSYLTKKVFFTVFLCCFNCRNIALNSYIWLVFPFPGIDMSLSSSPRSRSRSRGGTRRRVSPPANYKPMPGMVTNVLHNRPTNRVENEMRKLMLQKKQNEEHRMETIRVNTELKQSDVRAKRNLQKTQGKIISYQKRMEREVKKHEAKRKASKKSPSRWCFAPVDGLGFSVILRIMSFISSWPTGIFCWSPWKYFNKEKISSRTAEMVFRSFLLYFGGVIN